MFDLEKYNTDLVEKDYLHEDHIRETENNLKKIIEDPDLFSELSLLRLKIKYFGYVLRNSEEEFDIDLNIFIKKLIQYLKKEKFIKEGPEFSNFIDVIFSFFYNLSGKAKPKLNASTWKEILEILFNILEKIMKFEDADTNRVVNGQDRFLNYLGTFNGNAYLSFFRIFYITTNNDYTKIEFKQDIYKWIIKMLRSKDLNFLMIFASFWNELSYFHLTFLAECINILENELNFEDIIEFWLYGYFYRTPIIYNKFYQIIKKSSFILKDIDKMSTFKLRIRRNYILFAILGYLYNEDEEIGNNDNFPINIVVNDINWIEDMIWIVWKQKDSKMVDSPDKILKIKKIWEYAINIANESEDLTKKIQIFGRWGKWLIIFADPDDDIINLTVKCAKYSDDIEGAFIQDAILKIMETDIEKGGDIFFKILSIPKIFRFDQNKIKLIYTKLVPDFPDMAELIKNEYKEFISFTN